MLFVDACAIVSLLGDEVTADSCDRALAAADDAWTSPLAAFEAVLVLARPDKFDDSFPKVMVAVLDFLDARGIALRDAGPARDVLAHAVSVAHAHGVGRKKLSSFDCIHYAHAKTTRSALLTLDALLRETDAVTTP